MPFGDLKKNISASLVVFLVALPLSLGIAVASGAPARAGVISAIIGGMIVGFFSGAPLQVSGPAAGLSVLVFGLVQTLGFEKTCILTSIAGALQIIFGLLKTSRIALVIAPAVIHGMLAGIGVLITMGQAHVVLGSTPFSSGFQNLQNYPQSILNLNPLTFFLGASMFLILVLWKKFLPNINKTIPGSLVGAIVLTVFASMMNWDVPRVQLASDALSIQFGWNLSEAIQWGAILFSAFSMFAVASAESLLCAVATDRLHSGPRANLDRELVAQGIGNFLAGSVGGLPITGVIVRSSANISSGATSRISAILHGFWILIFIILGKDLIAAIPLSVLAGLLIHVGINLVKLDQIQHLRQYKEHGIYFATLFGVVFLGLLNGIGLGLGLTIAILLYHLSKIKIQSSEDSNQHWTVTIEGSATFLSVPTLSKALSEIPEKKKVTLHLSLSQLDLAGLETIRDWRHQYEMTGGKVTKPNLDSLIKK